MKRRFFILIFLFALSLRLFKIDTLPSEWYGDISNVHEYVTQILAGEWPFYFFQSPGPLYHYLIAPITWLFAGHGFETYKVAAIIVSFLGLITTFLFIREISSKTLALIVCLTMSGALWFVIWSRLGNSQIVIPALISFLSYFLVRYVKKGKLTDLVFTCLTASLGWYTYPQTFIFPVAFFIYLVFYLVSKNKLKSSVGHLVITIVLLSVFAIPFINIVRRQPDNFGLHGYVGQKVLPVASMRKDQLIKKLAINIKKTALMLHVEGDNTFRVNVASHSQLDWISGIVFFAGIIYFFTQKRRIWGEFIVWMLLILPLASISPVIPDGEIPNSARTIAIVPFVFLLVGAGYLWTYQILKHYLKAQRHISAMIVTAIFAMSVFSNLKLYFVNYAQGLPDRNLGPGRIIGQFIDKLPSSYAVYFSSCCWGEWGEPEPKGVAYVLRNKRYANYHKLIEGCTEVTYYPAVIIAKPYAHEEFTPFQKCSDGVKMDEIKDKNGLVVAKVMFLE